MRSSVIFPTARSIQIVSHFQSRTLTPQVSYLKAIDLWVLGCIFFVFSTLAEFGLVLYLTSRSAWQKRVDTYIKEKANKHSDIHLNHLSPRNSKNGQRKDCTSIAISEPTTQNGNIGLKYIWCLLQE